jgi:hypothetical protein
MSLQNYVLSERSIKRIINWTHKTIFTSKLVEGANQTVAKRNKIHSFEKFLLIQLKLKSPETVLYT